MPFINPETCNKIFQISCALLYPLILFIANLGLSALFEAHHDEGVLITPSDLHSIFFRTDQPSQTMLCR